MLDPEQFEKETGLVLADADALDATAVTPSVYSKWRGPRFGNTHPEPMNNPLWDWLIRTRISGYSATKKFDGPSPFDAGPAWCFDRFGQSCTLLPDGRRIFIAGEHEDHYDPDFYIYNDVVVWHPGNHIEIFGYPREVFPPTDFHTATLVNQSIVVIGNLGYPDERILGKVQVAVLSLCDLTFRLVATTGEMPSWIHGHKAQATADGKGILVRKGRVLTGDGKLVENINDWLLNLETWHWEAATRRHWRRFDVRRQDKQDLQLFMLKSAIDHPRINDWIKDLRGLSLDRKLFASLYSPPLSHEPIAESEDFEDEYAFKVQRIRVADVIVRFVDEDRAIHVVVEGELPAETCQTIAEHVRCTLEKIQNTACEMNPISESL